MYQKIHLTGSLPLNWEAAIKELRQELGYTLSSQGIPVVCRQGDALAVESDGSAVTITWSRPIELYRALSLIPRPLVPCEIHEKARFQTLGLMFDCSRNAVIRPEAMKMFLRKMALQGMNFGMLYTEDTYQVPEQPFFGYKRGRYTYEELKDLDDYADLLGIELCPCIQTLGHLRRILHWPAFTHLRDQEDVLLSDCEETYTLLDQCIRAASAPFRSKRIHLGMDEAFGVGVGAHLKYHDYEDPRAIMGRHLKKVLEITDKYGLKPMIWSDMYFHLDGCDYHSGSMPSQAARDAVDPRVSLVYWDYYHCKQEQYATALQKHACFPAPTVFAGGIWTWIGPAPSYQTTIGNTVPALKACMEAGVTDVIATAWGDNGAECNLTTALLGMQIFAEMGYTGEYDEEAIRKRFARCCHGNAQAFYDLSLLNEIPGVEYQANNPANSCKFMLYEDPLIQLFEGDTEGLHLSRHYESLVPLYQRYADENPEYELMFTFYAALASVLTRKCRWHEQAAGIVRSSDRNAALALASQMPDTIRQVNNLRRLWRRFWESTNKPNGFEVLEVRLAGVSARLETAMEKMNAFGLGEIPDIPELADPSLPIQRQADGSIGCTNTMENIATPGRID